MTIINQNGGQLGRGQSRVFNLNKAELLAVPKVANNNYYRTDEVWKRVVLDYISDVAEIKQTAQVLFDDVENANPQGKATVPAYLWGNLRIYSIHIYDKAGGDLILYPADLTAQQIADLKIVTGTTPAPSILLNYATDLSSAHVGVAAAARFGVGYGVRLYDDANSVYVGGANIVASNTGGLLTFENDFTGVTQLEGYSLRFADIVDCEIAQIVETDFGSIEVLSPAIVPVPDATTLSLDELSEGIVELSWTAMERADGYKIYRNVTPPFGGSASGFQLLDTVDAATLTYQDDQPLDDAVGLQDYEYYIVGYNETGDAAQSNTEMYEYPQDIPASPSITLGVVGTTATVSWSAIPYADDYEIFRLEKDETDTPTGAAQSMGTTATTEYVEEVPANYGYTYEYTVTARNEIGSSAPSNAVEHTVPYPIPATPTGLAVNYDASNVPTVSWDVAQYATSYMLGVSDTAGGPYTYEEVVGTQKVYAAAPEGETKYFVVAAKNASGTSADSSEISGTAPHIPIREPASGENFVYAADATGYFWNNTTWGLYWNGTNVTGPGTLSGTSFTSGGWTYYRGTLQDSGGFGDAYGVYRVEVV